MSPSTDLVLTIDKFTFRVPQDRLYSREDCWVHGQPASTVRIGLTDFRQQASGDVAFVETSPVGMIVAQGDEFATIETMKVDLAIPCPIRGTITTVNAALAERPELLNQDPYGEGWLVEMTMSDAGATAKPAQPNRLFRHHAHQGRGRTEQRMNNPILVIPCSGIGKVYGTAGRDAALQVVEDLRPGKTATMCLSLLVMGDEEARQRVRSTQTVTIDGCALACARKNVEMAGGQIGGSHHGPGCLPPASRPEESGGYLPG